MLREGFAKPTRGNAVQLNFTAVCRDTQPPALQVVIYSHRPLHEPCSSSMKPGADSPGSKVARNSDMCGGFELTVFEPYYNLRINELEAEAP